MKKVFPVLSIVIGLYWTIQGFNYGVWMRGGPASGFFPVVAGILTLFFGSITLKSVLEDKTPSEFSIKAFTPIIALFGLLLCSQIIGLILSIPIYIFVWMKFIEKYDPIKSAIVGVSCATVVYFVFVVWLRVPLPSGVLDLL